MRNQDNREHLPDTEMERLLMSARPETSRLDPEAARALFARALQESGVTQPKREWLFGGSPRWVLAAATCAFAFTLAHVAWQPGEEPVLPKAAPRTGAPVKAVAHPEPAPSPRLVAAQPTAIPSTTVRRSPRYHSAPRETRSRVMLAGAPVQPVREKPSQPTAGSAPSATGDPPSETLASLLIVTSDNSPAEVKSTDAPAGTEGYARVAAYDVDENGQAVVQECTVTSDGSGQVKTEYETADGQEDGGCYLKVEPAADPG
jgi:hypothetical protein